MGVSTDEWVSSGMEMGPHRQGAATWGLTLHGAAVRVNGKRTRAVPERGRTHRGEVLSHGAPGGHTAFFSR